MDKNNNQPDLKHYGVIGMHWGVRNAARGSAGAKRNSLNAKIRRTKETGRRASTEEFYQKANKLYKKAESIEKMKVKQMEASTKGSLARAFKRSRILDQSFTDTVNAQIKFEDAYNAKYGKLNKQRKSAKKTADKKIMAEWQKEADKMYKDISAKKLGFVNELKTVLAADKKLNDKYVTKLLEAELKIEQDYNKRAKR